MNSFLNRYSHVVAHRRWLTLIVCVLLTGLFLVSIPKLVVDNNPDIWSPADNEFVKATKDIERVFGGRHFAVIGIRSKDGDALKPTVIDKARRIEVAVLDLPGVVKSNVISLASPKAKDVFGKDGTLHTPQILGKGAGKQGEEELKQALARNPLYVDSLVSKDLSTLAVVADFRIEGEYTPAYEALTKIIDKERDDTVEILMAGEPVLSARTEKAMERLPAYFAMAFAIIALVQFYGFRSVQGMLLPLVSAVLAVIWTMGALAIAGVHVDPLSSTTPILIMAVATGHSLQILKRYYEEYELQLRGGGADADRRRLSTQAVITSLIKIGPVTFIAGLIAAVSFYSLAFSDTAVIRQFGVFAGTGVLMVIALEFTMVPALRCILPAPRVRAKRADALDGLLSRLGGLLKTRQGSLQLVAVSVVVLVAIIAGAAKLRVYNSFLEYYPEDSEVHRAVRSLNEKFGGADSISFLIDAGKADGIKQAQVLKAISDLQHHLQGYPAVGKSVSLADVVKRMHQAMSDEKEGMDVVPDSTPLIAQYLLLYSMSGGSSDFDSMVDSGYRKAVVRVFLRNDDTAVARRICDESLAFLKERLPSGVTAQVGGGLAESVAINDSVVRAKQINILQMIVVVFLLSSMVFASFFAGLFVAVPLLVILAVNLGFMGWAGISLDMGTATVVAMVIGIGADYEIYMLSRLKEEYDRTQSLPLALANSLSSSGKAVLLVALSIAGGYAALLTSDFGFYPRLALTMIATMGASAILSLVLLRVVIGVVKPRFIVSREPIPQATPHGEQ